jgi:hypothetical protein
LQPLTFKAVTVGPVVCNDDRDEAELHGRGTVDGEGDFQYRIRLRDDDEPGTGDMYSILIPDAGYYSGEQTLEGGNVQIR